MAAGRRAYLALAAGIFCIGWSAIFVRLAEVPGLTSAFYRSFFAAAVLVPWWLLRPPAQALPRARLWPIAAGGFFFGLDLALWNVAILMTTATTATLLANNAPIWVGLIAIFVFRERLGAGFWVGMAVALAGTWLIVGASASFHASLLRGHLLALGAGVFYALYLIVTQRVRGSVDTQAFTTVSVGACALLLLVLCLAAGAPLSGFNTRSWLMLLGLGLISHLGGWLAINYALGHMPAAVASVSLLSQTIVTAILSRIVLGERLAASQFAGGALVLAGVYLVNRSHQRKESGA
jgi:drug/metabolite transporter (DMT)-like permease